MNHLMSKPSADNRVSQCSQIPVWAVRWRLFLCGRLEFRSSLSHQHTLFLGYIIHCNPSIIYVTLHRNLSHASFTQKPCVFAVRITLIRLDITPYMAPGLDVEAETCADHCCLGWLGFCSGVPAILWPKPDVHSLSGR